MLVISSYAKHCLQWVENVVQYSSKLYWDSRYWCTYRNPYSLACVIITITGCESLRFCCLRNLCLIVVYVIEEIVKYCTIYLNPTAVGTVYFPQMLTEYRYFIQTCSIFEVTQRIGTSHISRNVWTFFAWAVNSVLYLLKVNSFTQSKLIICENNVFI